MRHGISRVAAALTGVALIAGGFSGAVWAQSARTWDPPAAARYLDKRQSWWQPWYVARLDHNTVCISCHTVLPYAFARPVLRAARGETTLTSGERNILASVEKRVNEWSEVQPYYSEKSGVGKSAQSRSTESVLNAVLLASYDSREEHVRPVTRTAFNNAFALQQSSGWLELARLQAGAVGDGRFGIFRRDSAATPGKESPGRFCKGP